MTTSIGCLLALVAAQAQEPTFKVVEPESVQLDSNKLAEIDTYMQKQIDDGEIVGCLGLIARGDKVAYFKVWGDMNRKKKKAMTADTIFRIYSMSKPITSIAAMQLVEQGKMDLDDPISKHLPALKDLKVMKRGEKVPAKNAITVRHVMSHQAGFTYGFFGNSDVDKAYRNVGLLMSEPTIEQTVKKLGKLPLQFEPGTRWHYSVATDVLGRLVEVVSGERFDKYLHKHIFEPLKMVDTSFMVPKEKMDRFAEMYREQGGDLKPSNRWASMRFTNPDNKYFSGGGGLCSTTKDYLRFSQALLRGGELDGARIIKAESHQGDDHQPTQDAWLQVWTWLLHHTRRRIRLGRCSGNTVLHQPETEPDRHLHDPDQSVRQPQTWRQDANHHDGC